jgi:protein-L-isoaspartate(D-aspartate) O-methyltransferase
MVERQLVPRGIRDAAVLDAMGSLPRHLFVEEALAGKAYSDNALPIGSRQTISQPYIVAMMTQLLKVGPTDRVLEIGTGSGYQTAVLARLCATVFSVERIPALAQRAGQTLRRLGIANAHVMVADGTQGLEEEAPFSRILVTAGAPSIPAPLAAQLTEGGRMVLPVGSQEQQTLMVVTRGPQGYRTESYDACVFVKLIGSSGWVEEGGDPAGRGRNGLP